MTVQSGNSSISHPTDGVQDVFSYDFLILDAAHLKVYLNGVLQSTGFTIVGVGNPLGGNVTFDTPPPTGEASFIRETTKDQQTDYDPFDPFPSAAHETALDKLTLIVQEQETTFINTVRAPASEVGPNMILPFKADRIGRLVSFDENGDVITVVGAENLLPEPGAEDSGKYLRVNSAETAYELFTQFLSLGGTAGVPTYSFVADPDTGFYLPVVAQLSVAVGGGERARFTTSGLLLTPGSETAPSLAFIGNPNDGFFQPAPNTIGISVAGNNSFRVSNGGGEAALVLSNVGDDIVVQIADVANGSILLKAVGNGSIKLGDAELAWPDADGAANQALSTDGNGNLFFQTVGGGGGSGDVVGPALATDEALARFDGTTGKIIQNSAATLSDTGNLSGLGNISLSGTVDGRDVAADGAKLDTVDTGATANSSDAVLLNRSNHTGNEELPNGSAAAPSFTFSNSAVDGLYSPGVNSVGVSIAGSDFVAFTRLGGTDEAFQVVRNAGSVILRNSATGGAATDNLELQARDSGKVRVRNARVERTFTAAVTVAQGDLCMLSATGMVLANASAEGTANNLLAIALEAITAASSGLFLLYGEYNETDLVTTAGALQYMSTAAGNITETKPALNNQVVRSVGYAISATSLWFDPDRSYVVLSI